MEEACILTQHIQISSLQPQDTLSHGLNLSNNRKSKDSNKLPSRKHPIANSQNFENFKVKTQNQTKP